MKKISLLLGVMFMFFGSFVSFVSADTVITTKIIVKTAPTKTAYIVGDKLDLSGLVVTLTQTGTTSLTKDVAFLDFQTNGITAVKSNGSLLTEKDTKVTLKVGKSITTSFLIKVSVNLACIEPQLAKREAAISAAYDAYATSMKTVLTKRASGLIAAWKLTGALERKTAIKTAWDTFRTEQKVVRTTRTNSVKTAWSTWKTDLNTCKITPAEEAQSLDLL